MSDIAIRLLQKGANGAIVDIVEEYSPAEFAGQLPSIGDTIVAPGVLDGLNRSKPENRTIWKVVGRVFNPKDNADYVALIVEERKGTDADSAFLT